MGTNNRNRRQAKKLKRAKQQKAAAGRQVRPTAGSFRSGSPLDCGIPHVDSEPTIGMAELRTALFATAALLRSGALPEYRSMLARLRDLEDVVRPALINAATAQCMDEVLERAWSDGWQPADVARVVRRTLSATHSLLVAPRLVESARRQRRAAVDDRWMAQIVAIEDSHQGSKRRQSDLTQSVELLGLFVSLPPLPALACPSVGGGSGRSNASATMLEKVRALLAKAESTTFPEEAESLTAKAQELMARHAIDQAMLESLTTTGGSEVGGWRIGIDDPYAGAKSLLLAEVALANRCMAVWSQSFGFSTVVGLRSDLEVVELFFTSLLVQATEAMVQAGSRVDARGRSRTRSFRQSFLVSYAYRIGERLSETAAAVVAEEVEVRGEALLPVLASRAQVVEEAFEAAFPNLFQRSVSIGNYSGWVAGRTAADLASLSAGQELAAG